MSRHMGDQHGKEREHLWAPMASRGMHGIFQEMKASGVATGIGGQ